MRSTDFKAATKEWTNLMSNHNAAQLGPCTYFTAFSEQMAELDRTKIGGEEMFCFETGVE
jgi:hypothetical protein